MKDLRVDVERPNYIPSDHIATTATPTTIRQRAVESAPKRQGANRPIKENINVPKKKLPVRLQQLKCLLVQLLDRSPRRKKPNGGRSSTRETGGPGVSAHFRGSLGHDGLVDLLGQKSLGFAI